MHFWIQIQFSTILEKANGMTGPGGPNCTPGYYNNEGKSPGPHALQSAPYGGGSIAFFELLEQWRKDGKFEGIEFSD